MTRASDVANFTSGVNSKDLNVSGIVTATGGFNIGIQSGGINVTTGVVTSLNFVGTGNSISYNPSTKTVNISITGGVGLATAGNANIGLGATILDFRGAGISTITVSSGIATINITGGGSGISGIGINSGGSLIGSGVTALNFITGTTGTATTLSYNSTSNTVDVTIPNPQLTATASQIYVYSSIFY